MAKTTVTRNIMGEGEIRTMILSSKDLTSGADYQRPVEARRVSRIVKKFDKHRVNPIKVSFRDGQYWVFNGQHTLVALINLNNGEDCRVRCEVHYGLTYEDEARLFAEQHDDETRVDATYKAKALSEAGDKDTLDMKRIAESVGLQMNLNHQKGANRLVAVSKLKSIYIALGASKFKMVLLLIKKSWDGEANSLDSAILGGVALFVKIYEGEFSEETFVKNLSRVTPIEIKRRGTGDYSCKGDTRYAKQIWDTYNFKLRKNSRLEWKL